MLPTENACDDSFNDLKPYQRFGGVSFTLLVLFTFAVEDWDMVSGQLGLALYTNN